MILGILQARRNSTRLPDKILRPLCGEPMIVRQIERLRRCQELPRLIVATTDTPADDAVESLCAKHGLECYRGPMDDVLARFHGALQDQGADHIARLTADCPVADPDVIDLTIRAHLESGADYTSNTLTRTYPKGLDVEVLTVDALETAHAEAVEDYEREHVTPFVYRRPKRFALRNVAQAQDLSQRRWTVDRLDDFERIASIYNRLYPTKPDFRMKDILALDAPD